MAFNDYTTLKAAILEEIQRPDLTDKVDDFIDLAEELHRDGGREDPLPPVRIKEMVTRVPLTLSTRYISLPDGYLQAQVFRILTTAAGEGLADNELTEVNAHEITRRRKSDANKLPPAFFCNHGNEIELDTLPDQAYGAEMIYYKAVDPLSDSNPTNAILQRSPRAYLYGACLFTAPYIMHDERITLWSNLYSGAAAGQRKADQAAKFTGPLVAAVAGSTP